MKEFNKLGLMALILTLGGVAACSEPTAENTTGDTADQQPAGPLTASFDSFTYTGNDPVYDDLEPGPNQYLNPVLAGFYPDPSVTQVGGDYYLVNSTFAYFPGLPVFHSTDLVNWTQLGNVIDRPGMLDFDGLGLSRGVFAPTIEHHDGTFYVANTCVDCGGNFIVTSEDPAGPWSDPIWTPEVGGIDPSLFFDDDGTVYMINNDAPVGEPRYDGHRAIWIRAVDPETLQPIEEQTVLLDGGVRPEENPIWIEGPHIYKVDGWYYLSSAEGGTAINHSQVIIRSRNIRGPWEVYEGNPILTQRDMDPNRDNPITSVGHADMVIDNDGKWWATFLGVRPYEGDYYNTGRETFLLPVEWRDGWPVILDRGNPVEYMLDRPALPDAGAPEIPMNGNFTLTEEFDGDSLDPYWMMVRVPKEEWWSLEDGALVIQARDQRLGDMTQPSYVGRRQQHLHGSAETIVEFIPREAGDEAGLAAFQNDNYYYAIGITLDDDGNRIVRLSQRVGEGAPKSGVTVASAPLAAKGPLRLKAVADGDGYTFHYAIGGGDWLQLGSRLDAKPLSTRTAGGFVGATFGMYAQRSPEAVAATGSEE